MSTGQKRKLFIHIGLFKTGTTSIQYFLNANMFHLYEMNYLYPSTGRHPRAHVQHTLVSDAFAQESSSRGDFTLGSTIDGPTVLKMLRHEIDLSGRQNIILSSESFCSLNALAVKRIGEAFADFDIIPIVYIRNLVDLADASYQTHVMANITTKTFAEMGFENWPKHFDIFAICKLWSSLNVDGKIEVFDFDQAKNQNIVLEFCRIVGLNADAMDKTYVSTRLNQSESMEIVAVKQILVRRGEPPAAVDSFLGTVRDRFSSGRSSLVPVELKTLMDESYSAQLEALAQSGIAKNFNPTSAATRRDKESIVATDSRILAAIDQYYASKTT